MAYSIRAAAGQPNFGPRPSVQGRDNRVKTSAASTGSSATAASSGKGIPLWAAAMLAYAAYTPFYCHQNTQKLIKEGWEKAQVREAEAKAKGKGKGKKEAAVAEAAVVEAPKEVAAVPVAPVAVVPATTASGTKERKWVAKVKEGKWVKPAVVVGVTAGIVGAAAYYEKKRGGNENGGTTKTA